MGKHSDYKKYDDIAAWDLNKGCRNIIDQTTPARRRLKKVLRRQARKRLNEQGEENGKDNAIDDQISFHRSSD